MEKTKLKEDTMKEKMLVVTKKITYFYVPVEASSTEDAEEKVGNMLERMSSVEFSNEFYENEEWEIEALTFKDAGFREVKNEGREWVKN